MRIHRIASTGTTPDFDAALRRASAVADELIGDNMLLSWYDRERDLESPAHVSECHEGCPVRGFWDYALNRGGALAGISTRGASCSVSGRWGNSLRPGDWRRAMPEQGPAIDAQLLRRNLKISYILPVDV